MAKEIKEQFVVENQGVNMLGMVAPQPAQYAAGKSPGRMKMEQAVAALRSAPESLGNLRGN